MQVLQFFDSDSLIDLTQYSDESTGELSSYSSKGDTVASTLVVVKLFRAIMELPEEMLDACANLVYATVQSIRIDCTYALQIMLYAFCEIALQWLVVAFGLPSRSVFYCLKLYEYCSGIAVLPSDATCAKKIVNIGSGN